MFEILQKYHYEGTTLQCHTSTLTYLGELMQYIDKKIAAFSTLDQFISWLDTLSVVEASATKSHINEIYAEDWDLSSLDSTILPWTNVCTEAGKINLSAILLYQ